MQSFAKLHLIAVLGAMLAVKFTLAAPLSTGSIDLIERTDAVEADAYLISAADLDALATDGDFNIGSFINKVKSVANKVKATVKTVATDVKPFIDTAAQIAQYTPLAPEAAIIHNVVDKAANL